MHQDNTAVLDFFYNILLYLLGSRIFPVERIDIPLHAIHITAVDRLYNIVIVITIRSTEQGGSFARKLLDLFVAGLNLTDHIGRRHLRHMRMCVAVIAHIVTVFCNILYAVGIILNPVAHKEKC